MYINLFGCFLQKTKLWKFERASEPTDIYWENLHLTDFQRFLRASISYGASLIFIGANFVVVYYIKNW